VLSSVGRREHSIVWPSKCPVHKDAFSCQNKRYKDIITEFSHFPYGLHNVAIKDHGKWNIGQAGVGDVKECEKLINNSNKHEIKMT